MEAFDAHKAQAFPYIGTAYLHVLSDDFGIWQHTNGPEIDRNHGYALDDSARALIAALRYGETELAAVYLEFVRHACCDFRHPVNFFDDKRQPLDRPISPDALGEVWWALGIASEYGFGTTSEHESTRAHIYPYIDGTHFLRTYSYATLPGTSPTWTARLVDMVKHGLELHAEKGWDWPEETLTYGNAIVPYSLLLNGETELGLRLLSFLNTLCIRDGIAVPHGNEHPHRKGEGPATYDQQPIEAAYYILANLAAWRTTGLSVYRDAARAYMAWFWGANVTNTCLISDDGTACHDGLLRTGKSPNRGAENIACYLIAQWEYGRDMA